MSKKVEKHEKSKDASFIGMISKSIGYILVAFFSFISGASSDFIKRDTAKDERYVRYLEKIIQEKQDWADSVGDRIMDVRKTREMIAIGCSHGNPLSPEKQDKIRFDKVDALVRTKAKGNYYSFYVEDAHKVIQELVAFDLSVEDVCAENAPQDEEWMRYLIKFRDVMFDSIRADQKVLLKINKGYFNGNTQLTLLD